MLQFPMGRAILAGIWLMHGNGVQSRPKESKCTEGIYRPSPRVASKCRIVFVNRTTIIDVLRVAHTSLRLSDSLVQRSREAAKQGLVDFCPASHAPHQCRERRQFSLVERGATKDVA